MIISKLSRLKACWHRRDYIGALRTAAKFPDLGDEKAAITRAWAAYHNPGTYEAMGMQPRALIMLGLQAIARRYDLCVPCMDLAEIDYAPPARR